MVYNSPELQVLLPIHNEAASIEATVREIYEALAPQVHVEFLLCEDGSTDGTKEILSRLAAEIPAKVMLASGRKGYSKAVRDGMLAADAPYLLCLDSDGQCDPADFARFWEARNSADVVIGRRVKRADAWPRRVLSRVFYMAWQALFRVPVHDPSCPFVLTPISVVRTVVHELGEMQQGFWWEFVARVHARGYRIEELPIEHRRRAAGVTQVYRLKKLPGIGYRHFRALFRIWKQARSTGRAVLVEGGN